MMVGETISHFKILGELAYGGMGVVYEAEDLYLDRRVALKFLSPHLEIDERAKSRFVQEAKAASKLDHPNVCTIHEIAVDDQGRLFIAMAYYQGETLKDRLEQGLLPVEKAVDIARQVVDGLDAAHKNGIIHRDIKPSNIMLTVEGRAVILDFGVAKLIGAPGATQVDGTVGTSHYMSPEQLRGDAVDHRSDIWSLGVVLYEMLTGERPFEGAYDQAVGYSILNRDPVSLQTVQSSVPGRLADIVSKCLQKDPARRYQQAVDLADDLAGTTGDRYDRVSERRYIASMRTPVFARSRLAGVIMTGIVIVFTILLIRPFSSRLTSTSSRTPIAVMPFANQTGETKFDYLTTAIPNLLLTNLERSDYLSPLTWERMGDLLAVMGRDEIDVSGIDRETGFDLCERDSIRAIVLGSFTKAGDVFALDMKVLDVRTKEMLGAANAKGNGVESILQHQIDEISQAISGVLQIPGRSFADAFRVADVTTSSMDAYRLYLEGRSQYERFNFWQAASLLEQAVAIDSTFPMAYYLLARSHRTIGTSDAGADALKMAMRYINLATTKEALYIRSDYALIVEGDLKKELALLTELVDRFPKEKVATLLLAGAYRRAGRVDDAITGYLRAIALDPDWDYAYNALGYAYALAGRYTEASEAIERYVEIAADGPNPLDSMGEVLLIIGRLEEAIFSLERASRQYAQWYGTFPVTLAYAYALKEDYPSALSQFTRLDSIFTTSLSADEHAHALVWTHREHARLLHYLGRYREALELLEDQLAAADRAGSPLGRATGLELAAVTYSEIGAFDDARSAVDRAFQARMMVTSSDSVRWKSYRSCLAGFSDVKAGRIESARYNLESAKRLLLDLDDEIAANWVELLAGEISLASGAFSEAVEQFRTATAPNPYYVSWWNRPVYATPVPRDGLARALFAVGDLDGAIREYRKLADFDPNQKGRFIPDPRYHYRLGRLYELKRWEGLAIQEYGTFLNLWKDADPNLADRRDAEDRLARLLKAGEEVDHR